MTLVPFTEEEVRVAASIGIERRLRAIRQGKTHRWGWDGSESWQFEIESTGAEMAVAKLLGVYWTDVKETDHDGDVGPGQQVRWTKYKNGHLIVHPEDEDDHRFMLVTGEMPHQEVVGFRTGAFCKQEEFWRGDIERPSFWVPRGLVIPAPGWPTRLELVA